MKQPPAIAITPTEITSYRMAARGYTETERLKAELSALRTSRDPFSLDIAELEPIFAWKLERQYGRNRRRRDRNTEADSAPLYCFAPTAWQRPVKRQDCRAIAQLGRAPGLGELSNRTRLPQLLEVNRWETESNESRSNLL